MDMTRRAWLGSVAALPLAAQAASAEGKTHKTGALVGREEFPLDGIYLNAAYTHPLPVRSTKNIEKYLARRNRITEVGTLPEAPEGRKLACSRFARMINADLDEVVLVSSTTYGENYVARGLGLGGPGTKVVSDILHFEGSLYLYENLKQGGMKHVIVPMRGNKIDLNDMEKAIGHDTTLVSVSYVSWVNGFQHDLKALCDLAHSRGALVYADVVQAAGAVPLDVKATGLDFCAASGFKWMMGEQGCGFLYVKKDHIERMHRPLYGYMQMATEAFHAYPFDPPGKDLFDFTRSNDIGGHFSVATVANGLIIGLSASLGLIESLGVENIQAHRIPLIRRLQQKLPEMGFEPMTPEESTAPIVTFACKDAYARFHEKLTKARINAQLYKNRLRVSPSVYNSMDDIDQLIAALA